MANVENFCLRLNEFETNVKIYWQQLQDEKDFCDVTLVCDDGQIKTHKIMISSCSPVFKNILTLKQNSHPLIYLRRVKYRDLQNIINFPQMLIGLMISLLRLFGSEILAGFMRHKNAGNWYFSPSRTLTIK